MATGDATVTVTVLLFAAGRTAAKGADRVAVPVPTDDAGQITAAAVHAALVRTVPALATIVPTALLARNHGYIDDPHAPWTPRPTDELALIPPVSGG